MKADRIHRAVSEDGVEIAGRVRGEGPPLVFVHGALDDGELDWGGLLPLLTDQFTCHVLSMRGRGLSGDGPDHSLERLARDVAAYVEQVGQPCGVVGLSGGGMHSLGAAARTGHISAVAAYEPIALEAIDRGAEARFNQVVDRMGDAVADDRPVDAARTFLEFVGNDSEFAVLNEPGALKIASRNLVIDLQEFNEAADGGERSPTAPSSLEGIAAPVLLMHGSRTALDWFTQSVRYYAENIPGAETRELSGAGHLGPILVPERVARELLRFFGSDLEAA